MTTWRDLEPRVKTLQRRGFVVKSAHRGEGLPKYLQPALQGCDILVVGAKNLSPSDLVCVMRLEWLERLLNEREATTIHAKIHSQ